MRDHAGTFVAYNRSFDSVLIQEGELKLGTKRLLEVDKRLILPIDVTLRLVVTSTDVLHSWSVPEMGIKVDAVPGRLNQFITLICRPGIFYGQCSELCGVAHGFMPIVVHAVPFDSFEESFKEELKPSDAMNYFLARMKALEIKHNNLLVKRSEEFEALLSRQPQDKLDRFAAALEKAALDRESKAHLDQFAAFLEKRRPNVLDDLVYLR